MTETVIELIICYFTGTYWVPPHSHRLKLYLNSWENWWRQMTRFYVDIKSKIPPTNALIQRTHTNYYINTQNISLRRNEQTMWLFFNLINVASKLGYIPIFILLMMNPAPEYMTRALRRVWRYQRGNQNPYIEEEQTTQWPK